MTQVKCRAKDPATCAYHGLKTPAEVQQSKQLAYVLRHHPESVGLSLDAAGWVDIDELAAAIGIPARAVRRLAAVDEKQRFTVSAGRIRAAQGHSAAVTLDLPTVSPPAVLYHGTIARFLPAILREGLVKGSRHAVHLSEDVSTATAVAARRGEPVILTVDAERMTADGLVFQRSANGVWLTETVPSVYLRVTAQS